MFRSSEIRPVSLLLQLVLFLSLVACSTQPPSPTLDQIARGEVEIVDLGYALNEENPHWPGESYQPFHRNTIATLQEDGVFSGAFSMPEHLGTHMDAPNHFELGQPSVDEIRLEGLVAPIVVIDIREACEEYADYQLSQEDLKSWEKRYGAIPSGSVVFALTGWGQYWNVPERYRNQDELGRMHFPGFSEEAAEVLVQRYKIKGIGIDTLSVDYGPSSDFDVHHRVNKAGAYQIENAANLEAIPASSAWLIAAPVKIENGSGGPARVWAVWTNDELRISNVE